MNDGLSMTYVESKWKEKTDAVQPLIINMILSLPD